MLHDLAVIQTIVIRISETLNLRPIKLPREILTLTPYSPLSPFNPISTLSPLSPLSPSAPSSLEVGQTGVKFQNPKP